jgi:hypothetical protein
MAPLLSSPILPFALAKRKKLVGKPLGIGIFRIIAQNRQLFLIKALWLTSPSDDQINGKKTLP